LAEAGLVRAGVDVTGFGLLGHLASLCKASSVGAVIEANRVPVVSDEVFSLIGKNCIPGGSRDNLAYANRFVEWEGVTDAQKIWLSDAQTSGGLLLCVAPRNLGKVLAILKTRRTFCAETIGQVMHSAKPQILVRTNRTNRTD